MSLYLRREEEIRIKAVEAGVERLEGELADVRVEMKGYLRELGL